MIPKLSTPLTKLVRTLEGLILIGANIALVVAPIVSSHVSPADSIKWGAIMNTITFASRQALKAVALAQSVGLPAPAHLLLPSVQFGVTQTAGNVAGSVASDISKGASVDEVLAQITAAEQAAATIQAQPGVPAQSVSAGLSPSPAPPAPQ